MNYEIEKLLFSENKEDKILGAIIALKTLSSWQITSRFNQVRGRWFQIYCRENFFAASANFTAVISRGNSRCFFISPNSMFYTDNPRAIRDIFAIKGKGDDIIDVDPD